MPADRNKENRVGGEFMIQDRDHLGDAGQMGGETGNTGRQADQSQNPGPQQGGQHDGGQQGSERPKRRSKLL